MSPKTILIGAGATAVIGGGSYGAVYLSQDKTIRHSLVRQGVTLISQEKEYQVAFKLLKGEKDFTDELSKLGTTITSSTALNIGGATLKKLCDKNLEEYLSTEGADKLIEKAKKYCAKPPLTIKEKFQRNKKKLVENWETKLEDLIKEPLKDEGLKEELTKMNNVVKDFNTPNKQVVAATLYRWCFDNSEKELILDNSADIEKKVDSRCLEPA